MQIYGIQNMLALNAAWNEGLPLVSATVDSVGFSPICMDFSVPDLPEEEYEQRTEGLGKKIMALRIVYRGKLAVCAPALHKSEK